MTEERRICVKQILDKVVRGIYKSTLYCIVFALICGIAFFFLYPHYQEYAYKKRLLAKRSSKKNGAKKNWLELLELD